MRLPSDISSSGDPTLRAQRLSRPLARAHPTVARGVPSQNRRGLPRVERALRAPALPRLARP